MTTRTESDQIPQTETFHAGQVAPIVGAHFIHDIYTATLAPLLPVIIEKLTLSYTQAGSLSVFLQLPAMLNPFIGYMADRVSLRYFVIFAPAVTATLISSLSFIDTFVGMIVVLLATGVSVAAFHAPAPAMIARVSGKRVGFGMSLFMAAGEFSRSIGPLIAVWAVTMWTLDGFFRIVVLGWGMTAVLYWQLRDVPGRTDKIAPLRELRPFLRTLYLPLGIILFFRNFMMACLTLYLPTFLEGEGASLWLAGAALSILEFAGVAGALSSGTISDKVGRKMVLFVAALVSAVFLIVFLNVNGLAMVPVLVFLGFSALSTTPVMLAIVQDQLPHHRAVGNGLFIFMSFAIRSVAVLVIGYAGDNIGLRPAYFWSAIVSLGAIPAIFMLPGSIRRSASE